MTSKRKPFPTQLRRSISEQLRDSTARAWDLLWKNVRERRLAGRCPRDSGAAGQEEALAAGGWRRGPPGPPPAAALGSPARVGPSRPRSPPAGPRPSARAARAAGWVWVPSGARADSPAGRHARLPERPPGLPGKSASGRPPRRAGPCSAAFHPGNE